MLMKFHQNGEDVLLNKIEKGFEDNMHRHESHKWDEALKRLKKDEGKLWSLNEMEKTGGEPDVVRHDSKTGEFVFFDNCAESPEGRRKVDMIVKVRNYAKSSDLTTMLLTWYQK